MHFRLIRYFRWLYPATIWKIKDDNAVFITFDDGPHPTITPFLLDLAKEKDVKLSFFWLGENLKAHPQFLALAEQQGHLVGSHGMHHINGWKISKEAFLDNVTAFEKEFGVRAFRPPYGKIKPSAYKTLSQKRKIVLWSWLSYDWEKNVSDAAILKSLDSSLKAGDILVFHENQKTLERAKNLYPEVFDLIKAKGYMAKALPL
ncbi:MAG: polysaccharide deacetylase family protein [Crocinitomicaceae bacterium]|jgi:peptidoglycan/xylan/chitin deacetylase (PgdA/CDA1 family)|nr:polysaccharide deacetylase family protein [Crocinitomicaceae bacterium]